MTSFNIILIVGVGRSGTSLLQSMFAAHPAVAYMPETSFLRRYLASACLHRIFSTEGEKAVVKVLKKDEVFARTGLEADELVCRAVAEGGPLDVAIYKQMAQTYLNKERFWVGDKDPRLIEFLPLLKILFPNAQVINIIRDPRDVLASKKKAVWSKKGHVWKHIFANRVQLRLGRDAGPFLFGEKYHEIIYEELLNSPQEVLAGLCKKMGLPFNSQMLSFGGAAKKLVSEKELSWKKETFGPLLRDNKNKWKNSLNPREILLTESCCQEVMPIGNYGIDKRAHRLDIIDRLWIATGSTLIKLSTLPYTVYRKYKLKKACRLLG